MTDFVEDLEDVPQSGGTDPTWKLVWVFDKGFKPEWDQERVTLARLARDSGGRLVCLKSQPKFERWTVRVQPGVYSVMVSFNMARAMAGNLRTAPSPVYLIVQCDPSTWRWVVDWFQAEHLPQNIRLLFCREFDHQEGVLLDVMTDMRRLVPPAPPAPAVGLPAPLPPGLVAPQSDGTEVYEADLQQVEQVHHEHQQQLQHQHQPQHQHLAMVAALSGSEDRLSNAQAGPSSPGHASGFQVASALYPPPPPAHAPGVPQLSSQNLGLGSEDLGLGLGSEFLPHRHHHHHHHRSPPSPGPLGHARPLQEQTFSQSYLQQQPQPQQQQLQPYTSPHSDCSSHQASAGYSSACRFAPTNTNASTMTGTSSLNTNSPPPPPTLPPQGSFAAVAASRAPPPTSPAMGSKTLAATMSGSSVGFGPFAHPVAFAGPPSSFPGALSAPPSQQGYPSHEQQAHQYQSPHRQAQAQAQGQSQADHQSQHQIFQRRRTPPPPAQPPALPPTVASSTSVSPGGAAHKVGALPYFPRVDLNDAVELPGSMHPELNPSPSMLRRATPISGISGQPSPLPAGGYRHLHVPKATVSNWRDAEEGSAYPKEFRGQFYHGAVHDQAERLTFILDSPVTGSWFCHNGNSGRVEVQRHDNRVVIKHLEGLTLVGTIDERGSISGETRFGNDATNVGWFALASEQRSQMTLQAMRSAGPGSNFRVGLGAGQQQRQQQQYQPECPTGAGWKARSIAEFADERPRHYPVLNDLRTAPSPEEVPLPWTTYEREEQHFQASFAESDMSGLEFLE